MASCRRSRLDNGKPFDPIAQIRSRDHRLPANLADWNFASSYQLVKFRSPNCSQTAALGDCEQQLVHEAWPSLQLAGMVPATVPVCLRAPVKLFLRQLLRTPPTSKKTEP